MNLLVIGDYTYGDSESYQEVGELLDHLHSDTLIENVVTFDTDGFCYLSTVWAYEEKVPFKLLSEKISSTSALANAFLRKIVDDNKIDAFLFVFKEVKDSEHKNRIRSFFNRAKKAFKQQKVFVNKEI